MTSEPSYTANQSGSSDLSVGATVVRAASREIPEDRVAPLLQGPSPDARSGKEQDGNDARTVFSGGSYSRSAGNGEQYGPARPRHQGLRASP